MFGLVDPMKLKKKLWPHVADDPNNPIEFYDKQIEIVYSVFERSVITVVPAANLMGKDFVTGFIKLVFFLTRHPCKVVSTSSDESQLKGVLWGELKWWIQQSKVPLVWPHGPLKVNDLEVSKYVHGQIDPLSYIKGKVAKRGESMLGHHIKRTGDFIDRTLGIADECSGVDNDSIERMETWANRMLLIGNCYRGAPGCSKFKELVKGGCILAA